MMTATVISVLALSIGCGHDTPSRDIIPDDSEAPERLKSTLTPTLETGQHETAPSTSPTSGSAVSQLSEQQGLTSSEELLPNGTSTTEEERVDPDYISILIPSLDESVYVGSGASGELIQGKGPVPMTIAASTSQCELVFIDTLTSQSTPIWDYPTSDDRDFDCEHLDASGYSTSDGESLSSYIDNLEWANPNFLLVSLCCEPAVGRFEVIDTSKDMSPFWLALNGNSPSLNESNRLLYSVPLRRGEQDVGVVGSIAFDVRYDESDPDYPFYNLESGPIMYALSIDGTDVANVHPFVSDLSWVGEDKIAFELWAHGPNSSLHPFIGLIDLGSDSTIVRSRTNGWTLPSGDGYANLVVAEQACHRIERMTTSCTNDETKIVVLDSDSLAPIHETVVNGSVVDMDLHRGWLLVTFSNGRMGVLDPMDGSFSQVATGIAAAVWTE